MHSTLPAALQVRSACLCEQQGRRAPGVRGNGCVFAIPALSLGHDEEEGGRGRS